MTKMEKKFQILVLLPVRAPYKTGTGPLNSKVLSPFCQDRLERFPFDLQEELINRPFEFLALDALETDYPLVVDDIGPGKVLPSPLLGDGIPLLDVPDAPGDLPVVNQFPQPTGCEGRANSQKDEWLLFQSFGERPLVD